jgi:hypothetical protein
MIRAFALAGPEWRAVCFCWSKEGFAVELDDAPLAKTRFDVSFGFTAFVAAFQEFADELAQDFAVAVGTDPDFLEMSEDRSCRFRELAPAWS